VADELTGQVADTPIPGAANEPETPATDGGVDTLPPEYSGKSTADLAKILKDKQGFIEKQAEEIGELRRLREEVSYLKGAIESRQYERGMEVGQPEKPEEFEFDFTRPKESVERLLDARLAQERKALENRERARNAWESQAAFERGKRTAYEKDPALYRGIERDIETALFNAWKAGAATKETLENPKTWRTAAIYLRDDRGELDGVIGRRPVTPATTERPSAVKPRDEDEVAWDERDRREMARWGIGEKEALEGLKRGVQMREEGALK